jgi:hypothetical protein
MSSGIQFTTEQLFHVEQFNRALDATTDPGQLRDLAKQLLQAWQTQKAATNWILNQQLQSSSNALAMARNLGRNESEANCYSADEP